MKFNQWIISIWILLFQCIFAVDTGYKPRVTRTNSEMGFNIQAFDDSTTLIRLERGKVCITDDNGETWKVIEDIKKEANWIKIDDNYKGKRAYVSLITSPDFYMTEDMGKSWRLIQIKQLSKSEGQSTCFVESHPTDSKGLLVHCTVFNNDHDENKNDEKEKDNENTQNTLFHTFNDFRDFTYVSTDNGNSFSEITTGNDIPNLEKLEYLQLTCSYAMHSKKSTLKDAFSLIYCNHKATSTLERGDKTKAPITVTTTIFFKYSIKTKKVEIFRQFEDMAVELFQVFDSKLLILTKDDRYNLQSTKTLWVSIDGATFNSAYLPTQLRFIVTSDITEDSIGRIILPIERQKSEKKKNPLIISEILISDSTGLKFSSLPWSNTEDYGYANLYVNPSLKGSMIGSFVPYSRRRSKKGSKSRHSISKITNDNGATWSNIKVVDPKNKEVFSCDIEDYETCSLHLSGVTRSSRVPTAGILMSVGFVGDGSSFNWSDGMTFTSRDGGETWQLAFKFPTVYSYGDNGNVIIAVPVNPDEDDDPEGEFYFSLDQGQTWTEYELEKSIFPMELISTTPDGSGVKFILNGFTSNSRFDDDISSTNIFYAIDFSDAFGKTECKTSDLETWELAKGSCINGAKYSVERRKVDSKCLMRKVYDDLEFDEKICTECTLDDYECSFEFQRDDNNKCIPNFQLLSLSGSCSLAKSDKISLKPRKLIEGNKCKNELTIESVDVNCEDLKSPDNLVEKIKVTETSFEDDIVSYKYFDTDADETLLITTSKNSVYISHDGGTTVKKVDTDDDEIIEIVFNPYFNSTAYLFSKGGLLFATHDRGQTFVSTKLPEARQLGLKLEFHAINAKTFIYYGGKDCDSMYNSECHAVAYITRDGGATFREMLDNAIHCKFSGSTFNNASNEDLVICQTLTSNKKKLLKTSTDFFESDSNTKFDDIVGFMSTGEFLIVAVPFENDELRAYVTIDGIEFAEANFPQYLENIKQESFTVLSAESGSIFLHLATNMKNGGEYGQLLKSNSNGTSFVSLESAVNRNSIGFIDFEKIQGLEGIIIINTVGNINELEEGTGKKRLKSKISFNDGSDWSYIQPPTKDSEGKKYNCAGKGLDKCSLHLHGYTERADLRDTFSSGSAFGMMIGVGNVGESLLPKDVCSTFLTIDGGATWSEVKKGSYQWEFGDHGSVVVLVPDNSFSDSLFYSLDAGKTWADFKFSGEKVSIRDIVTVPRDSAMRFLIISKSRSVRGGSSKLFSIDFSKCFERQCVYDPEDEKNDDFEYTSFSPLKGQCLFGHKSEYLKRVQNDCFVGAIPLAESVRIVKNCTCTRNDFECDYNYYKANDGTCKLVEGLNAADPSGICKKNPDEFQYFETAGYRKIPLSTCEGGLNLSGKQVPKACPGKKNEFKEHYSINGVSYTLLSLYVFVFSFGCVWFVYERGIRRNGGFSRFGEIRLGDDLIEENQVDKTVNGIVRSCLFMASSGYSRFQMGRRWLENKIELLREQISGRRGPSYNTLFHDQFLDDADDLLEGHDEDANDLPSFMDHDSNFEIDVEDELENHPEYTDDIDSHGQTTDDIEQTNVGNDDTEDDII